MRSWWWFRKCIYGVVDGGKNPTGNYTETEEYNGTSWSTGQQFTTALGGTQKNNGGIVDVPHGHGSYGEMVMDSLNIMEQVGIVVLIC